MHDGMWDSSLILFSLGKSFLSRGFSHPALDSTLLKTMKELEFLAISYKTFFV